MLTGYIEGYYGVELSWKERNSIISKLHEVGCNTYFYCPKEDPYHRVNWKDDYPVGWIEDFREFKSNADRVGIDIIFGISPGASLDLKDFEYLERKIDIFKELSIKNFCILFDDIPKEKEQFSLHRRVLELCLEKFPNIKLSCVPSQYCKNMVEKSNNDYLTELDKVDTSIPFFWTGNQVITSNYSNNNIDSWKALFREDRDLIIWDNTFANDYCVPKIVMQNFDGFFSVDDKKVSGFLLNASGIELIDLIAIEILDDTLKENHRTLEDILKDRGFPKELINLSHFFKINISSTFSDDEKKDLDFLLWNWNGKIKKFFYPYLHQLSQIFNETDQNELNGLKKRFRVKE